VKFKQNSLNSFIKDVSYNFLHLKDLNKKDLLNNVKNWDIFFNQLTDYFKDKNSIKNKSEDIVIHLCEYKNEGIYGQIFAKQIIKILNT
jgi:hypothetical protein